MVRLKNLKRVAAMLLGVGGICLVPYSADATSKYDGSTPFLCVPTAVAECLADGDCRPGTAQSENLPDFFRVDLKTKSIGAQEKGRQSVIERTDRKDNEITLYGTEAGRSWVLMISERTGRMSASVIGDGQSYIIFGVCPPAIGVHVRGGHPFASRRFALCSSCRGRICRLSRVGATKGVSGLAPKRQR